MTCTNLSAVLVEREILEPPIMISYPEVIDLYPPQKTSILKDVPKIINSKMNKTIKQMAVEMGSKNPDLEEMLGTYQTTLNRNGLLSIKLENFSNIKMQAHPWNIMQGMNFNLETGKTIDIFNLFKPGSNYRLIISREIKRQIEKRNIPIITKFERINDDQAFYLTDKEVVVFFNELP